ncbi:MAG: hypothetical protein GWQ05_23500, partial [Verrucomicrobiaceae bacterium]|nr:hypothetical protein [Verrucomicrobiaceae bacterium]
MTQDRFHLDEKVTEVLNLIDAGKYDQARHTWIFHLISLNGCGELQLNPGLWDLFSDSSVHTSVCKLFQMKVKNVYDDCNECGDECVHHDAYSGEAGLLASQEYNVPYLDVAYSNYDSLQDYFDKEHNTFGKLGIDSKT